MALQVWLPLINNLNNNGVANINIIASGTEINSAGKLGSSYQFDGSDDYISLDGNSLYNIFKGGNYPFSIAFWIYHNDSNRGIIFGDYGLSGTIRFNIELTTSHRIRFYWDASPDKTFSTETNVELQKWNHIAITYDGLKINCYKNGICSSDIQQGILDTKNKTTGLFFIGRDNRTGNTAFNGKINDFRIYDHCLSAAEVKEISQGLVLHYKLDDFTNGVIDSSGYNNNGTLINFPSTTTSTGKYSNCAHFTATNQHIQCKTIPTANFGDSYTFSWYGRRASSSSTMFWGFSNGIRLNGLYKGTLWNTSDSNNNPIYNIGTTTTITAPTATDWHHYVMTGNGTKCYLYLDGELYGEAKTYKSISGTQIYLNGWANSTSYSNADMDMSDFRIYATALSADDIRQLYQLGAKLDNKQNLHTYELIENLNLIRITKRGQTKCQELTEYTTTKFYDDFNIDTNTIIER